MNKNLLQIFSFCLAIFISTSLLHAAETSFDIDIPMVPGSANSVDFMRNQAQEHEKLRDTAIQNLQQAGNQLEQEYWMVTIIKEEAKRLLMLIGAVKTMQKRGEQDGLILQNQHLLANDPVVQAEIRGLTLMFTKLQELSAARPKNLQGNPETRSKQINKSILALSELYSPQRTTKALERHNREFSDKKMEILVVQYSQLRQQFNQLTGEQNI